MNTTTVSHEYITSSLTPSQTKVCDDPAAVTDNRTFWISTNVPMISVMRRFGTEQVHVILVKDQIALTEDDVTMDRRDAERILVVNLQQSCFRLCQNSESVPGAAQEN